MGARIDDSKNLLDGLLDQVVEHDVVEPGRFGQLGLGLFQPALHGRARLRPPGGKAPGQLLLVRGLQEHEDGVGGGGADAGRALDVELEEDVAADVPLPGHLLGGSSVPLPEDLGPLQEGVAADQRVELTLGDESVLDPLGLAGAGLPGGVGDGEHQVRASLQETPNDGPLSHPGGAGDDEEPAAADGRYFFANSAARATFCFAPSPRTRRLEEMSSRSMIFLARTFPTPGSDSRTAETFIFPTTPSPCLARMSLRFSRPVFN